MDTPTQEERENCARQAELIHVTLGYHEARMRSGHPFALGNRSAAELDYQHPASPRLLAESLRNQTRIPLDLSTPSSIESPVTRIRHGVTASVWDSYNQIFGSRDDGLASDTHPLLDDGQLRRLMEEMDRAGASMREADPTRVTSYDGTTTIHSGFKVGIGLMTTLAAIEEGIPEGHPFDAVTVSRIIAKTESVRLAIAQMEFGILCTAFPGKIPSFLSAETQTGLSDEKFGFLTGGNAHGCPALLPMKAEAREILQRHGLYFPELDNSPAIKILGGKIRDYVRDCIGDLRVTMDFHDSKRLPEFDRRVVDRMILGAPVSARKKA